MSGGGDDKDNDICASMDAVADEIVALTDNDETIRPEALSIAQFLLHTESLSEKSVLEQLRKPGARVFVEKLLNCESEIMSPTPRCLGVDISSFISADKIQKSLDVKHLHLAVGSKRLDRIIPVIKPIILYSHSTSVWVRFYSDSRFFRDLSYEDDEDYEEEDEDCCKGEDEDCKEKEDDDDDADRDEEIAIGTATDDRRALRSARRRAEELMRSKFGGDVVVVRVCPKIYELYADKSKDTTGQLDALLRTLEYDFGVYLVFCSELAYFKYNKLLFLSNYIKFMWCYALNREIFNPKTMNDVKIMITYLTYGLLFLECNNLTNMPQHTHNPLITYTGERPKISMSKFNRNQTFTAEGSRAMLTMNKCSDFGIKSNFIEITSVVDISDECIKNIL